MLVETRTRMQHLAARMSECLLRLVADLVERLQAVGGEARHGDEHFLHARLRQLHEAVVVAEYCGYIGSTIRRSTPCSISSCSTSASGGLPICMPKRTGTSGSSFCSSSVWRRV